MALDFSTLKQWVWGGSSHITQYNYGGQEKKKCLVNFLTILIDIYDLLDIYIKSIFDI